jgi:hypothetical protein
MSLFEVRYKGKQIDCIDADDYETALNIAQCRIEVKD